MCLMKKLSTIYLLGVLVTLGSCAREYPVFNQMPKNAYIGQPNRSEVKAQIPAETAVVAVEKSEVAEEVPVQATETSEPQTFAGVMADPRVAEMLAEKTPRQIDEQLESALATTEGQKLMAKPAVAAQIKKVRTMLANSENLKVNTSDLSSKVSTIADKQFKKSMEPAAAKALNNKIRIGLILVLIGLLLGLIPGVGWTLGSIVSVVGIVFIVLGLIDNV